MVQREFDDWGVANTYRDLDYNQSANLNPDTGMDLDFPSVDFVEFHAQGSYQQDPPHQLSLEDSKPADFLAIRDTSGRRSCQL